MKTPYHQGLLALYPQDLYLYAPNDEGHRGVAECRDGEFSKGVNEANAARLRDTWNACQGLDLPADVEPGTLKEAVDYLQSVVDASDYAGEDLIEISAKDAREILAKLSV